MMGYWNNREATKAILSADGWLNTGDTARIDAAGHVFITGRLKEIIVLSNGEKVPPGDVEAAIMRDPLFEQVMLIGEGKPFLSVIAVLSADRWRPFAVEHGLDANPASCADNDKASRAVLARITAQMSQFPGYAQVRRVTFSLDPWTVENGMLTPTMKLKRAKVMEKFGTELDSMYAGH
jgi:long-chain acyl-CoA synthetase